MAEKQKKTRKTTITKKQESELKENKTNKQAKTTKVSTVEKATKAAKKQTPKAVEEMTPKNTVKSQKESAKKKASKPVKKAEEAKATKTVKKTVAKKSTKTTKKAEEKPAEEKKEVHSKKDTTKVKENIEKESDQKVKEKKTTKTKKEVSEKKSIEKSDEKQEKEVQQKEQNRTINISVGTIASILIIIALLVLNIKLGIHAYNVTRPKEAIDSGAEIEEDASTTQEIGSVLSKNNEVAHKIIDKLTFSPNVTASIYNLGAFSSNNIPNDIKLKIGWTKTTEPNKSKSTNENNEVIEVVEKTKMDETIKSIFGPNETCKSESIDYTDVSLYSINNEKISYSEGLYTRITKQEEEKIVPIVYQEVQKVVRYSESIVVYVKTAFINVEDNKYVAYKKFSNNQFTEELVEIETGELFGTDTFNNNTGEGTISIEHSKALDSIRNQLGTYKYTFTLDKDSQEYYLSGFKQEENNL